jgi:hypothetical protein
MQFRGTGSTAYECLFVPIQASIERISPKDKKFGLCLTGVRPRSEAEVEDPGFPASGTTPPPLLHCNRDHIRGRHCIHVRGSISSRDFCFLLHDLRVQASPISN